MIRFSPQAFDHKTYQVLADLLDDKSMIKALVRIEQARDALLRTFTIDDGWESRYLRGDYEDLISAIATLSMKQLTTDLGFPEYAAEEILEFIDSPGGTIFDNVIRELRFGAMRMQEIADDWEATLKELRRTRSEDD